ncbi:hypothetical protein CYMTET_34503, partial [Cymbomonas tetramitiformis]
AGELSKINAWIGTAGTVTPCHYDSYDNLLTQVVGYKYIKLFAPSQTPLLYRSYLPWHLQRTWPTMDGAQEASEKARQEGQPGGTISLVDVEKPDLGRFPLFQDAVCEEVLLGPATLVVWKVEEVALVQVTFYIFLRDIGIM